MITSRIVRSIAVGVSFALASIVLVGTAAVASAQPSSSPPSPPSDITSLNGTPFISQFPPTCQAAGASALHEAQTRLDSCTAYGDLIKLIHVDEDGVPEVIGTVTIGVVSYSPYNARSRSWNITQYFSAIGATGVGVGLPVSAAAGNICSNSSFCTVTPFIQYSLVVPSYPKMAAEPSTATSPGTLTTSGNVSSEIGFVAGGFVIFPHSFATSTVRCDSQIKPAGCVNPTYVPTVLFDGVRNPKIAPVADHVTSAQATLTNHPGAQVFGSPLTRDTSASDIARARRIACAPKKHPPSCDEYPMASTYQSAAFTKNYSVFGLPVSANNSQGGTLSAFYSSQRVLNRDAFYVSAIP